MPQLGRYTLEDIRQHRTADDAWTAIQGKVYNLTPYLKFHPGGVKDLMRCAGRDGTKLFSKYKATMPKYPMYLLTWEHV